MLNLLRSATHTLAIDASSLHVYTNEWLPTASTLCPLSLSREKAQVVSPSYVQKSKTQMDHLSCYSARLAEERRKKERKKQEDEQFWLTISGLLN